MKQDKGWPQAVVFLAAVLLLGQSGLLSAALWALGRLIPPFAWAGVLAMGMQPPMARLEKRLKTGSKNTRRGVALAVTLAGLFFVLALLLGQVVPQVVHTGAVLIQNLPELQSRLLQKAQGLLACLPGAQAWVRDFLAAQPLTERLTGWLAYFMEGRWNAVGDAAAALGGAAADFALGLVLACYVLLCRETLAAQFGRLVRVWLPPHRADRLLHGARLVRQAVGSFLTGQCLEACILGCMFALTLSVCRMPGAVLISVIIACTAIVPIVGSFAGCAVGLLIVFAQAPEKTLWFLVLFLCLQQIEGALIYPRIVGHSVGLPPIWIFVSVLAGGRLFGIAGILFMIPLSSVAYVLLGEATRQKENDRRE